MFIGVQLWLIRITRNVVLHHCNESSDLININYSSIGVSELSIICWVLFIIATPSNVAQQIFIRCLIHDMSPVLSVWRLVYGNLIKSIRCWDETSEPHLACICPADPARSKYWPGYKVKSSLLFSPYDFY